MKKKILAIFILLILVVNVLSVFSGEVKANWYEFYNKQDNPKQMADSLRYTNFNPSWYNMHDMTATYKYYAEEYVTVNQSGKYKFIMDKLSAQIDINMVKSFCRNYTESGLFTTDEVGKDGDKLLHIIFKITDSSGKEVYKEDKTLEEFQAVAKSNGNLLSAEKTASLVANGTYTLRISTLLLEKVQEKLNSSNTKSKAEKFLGDIGNYFMMNIGNVQIAPVELSNATTTEVPPKFLPLSITSNNKEDRSISLNPDNKREHDNRHIYSINDAIKSNGKIRFYDVTGQLSVYIVDFEPKTYADLDKIAAMPKENGRVVKGIGENSSTGKDIDFSTMQVDTKNKTWYMIISFADPAYRTYSEIGVSKDESFSYKATDGKDYTGYKTTYHFEYTPGTTTVDYEGIVTSVNHIRDIRALATASQNASSVDMTLDINFDCNKLGKYDTEEEKQKLRPYAINITQAKYDWEFKLTNHQGSNKAYVYLYDTNKKRFLEAEGNNLLKDNGTVQLSKLGAISGGDYIAYVIPDMEISEIGQYVDDGIMPYKVLKQEGGSILTAPSLVEGKLSGTLNIRANEKLLSSSADVGITEIAPKSQGVSVTKVYSVDDLGDPGWIERLVAGVIHSVATAADGILTKAGVRTIEEMIFNKSSVTSIDFFGSGIGTIADDSPVTSMRGIVFSFYKIFRNIALAFYFLMLIITGIKIGLTSIASEKSKHMELLKNWLVGILIIILFNYVMSGVIVLSARVIEMFSGAGINGGGIEKFFHDASARGHLIYSILYCVALGMRAAFGIMYFKRVLIVGFLIAIFPLIAISYAIDKVGDGKAQALNKWFKEFTVNVVVQLFHAIIWVVIGSIAIATADPSAGGNWLFALVAMFFLFPAEGMVRSIFGVQAESAKGLGSAFMTMATVKSAFSNAKGIVSKTTGKDGILGGIKEKRQANAKLKKEELQTAQDKNKLAELDTQLAADDVARTAMEVAPAMAGGAIAGAAASSVVSQQTTANRQESSTVVVKSVETTDDTIRESKLGVGNAGQLNVGNATINIGSGNITGGNIGQNGGTVNVAANGGILQAGGVAANGEALQADDNIKGPLSDSARKALESKRDRLAAKTEGHEERVKTIEDEKAAANKKIVKGIAKSAAGAVSVPAGVGLAFMQAGMTDDTKDIMSLGTAAGIANWGSDAPVEFMSRRYEAAEERQKLRDINDQLDDMKKARGGSGIKASLPGPSNMSVDAGSTDVNINQQINPKYNFTGANGQEYADSIKKYIDNNYGKGFTSSISVDTMAKAAINAMVDAETKANIKSSGKLDDIAKQVEKNFELETKGMRSITVEQKVEAIANAVVKYSNESIEKGQEPLGLKPPDKKKKK